MISDLPTELLFHIFSYLSMEDIFWGAGISCNKLLNVSLDVVPNFMELPKHRRNCKGIMTYLIDNVFQWNEVRDIVTCVLVCSPDQNAKKIYESTNCIPKSYGITLPLVFPSSSFDTPISSILQNFRNIECFILEVYSWNDLEQLFPNSTGKCKNLRCIHVSKASNLTDEEICYMTLDKHNLQCLHLYESLSLSDVGIYSISCHCNGLIELRMSWCDNLTDNAIIQLSQACNNMSVLHLGGCCNITDTGIQAALSQFKRLVDLNISGCHLVTDNSFISLSNSCNRLKKLNLGGCTKITDITIESIAMRCLELEYLYLSGCINITDNGAKYLSNCKHLIYLSLFACHEIGDTSITEITHNCKLLKVLILYRCHRLSNKAVNCIAENLVNLDTLDLRYCPQVTDLGIKNVAQKCGYLTRLYLDSAFYRKSSVDERHWYELFSSSTISLSPSSGPFFDGS